MTIRKPGFTAMERRGHLLLLLLLQHYNPGWVLAFSTRLFHSFPFPINSFHFFTLSTCISLRIPSIHLFLGLNAGLFPNGFQLVRWRRRHYRTQKVTTSWLRVVCKSCALCGRTQNLQSQPKHGFCILQTLRVVKMIPVSTAESERSSSRIRHLNMLHLKLITCWL